MRKLLPVYFLCLGVGCSDKVEDKRIKKSQKAEPLKNDNEASIVAPEKPKLETVKETEIKENVKSAKDWGRASNDPRNKA